MLEVKLIPELETALSREARRVRKSKATLILDAVAQYLQEADDYQAVLDAALADGYVIGQEGSIGGEKGRFAYLDTEREQGNVIELSDISGPKGQFFQYIRSVAADWDGSDPIRGRA